MKRQEIMKKYGIFGWMKKLQMIVGGMMALLVGGEVLGVTAEGNGSAYVVALKPDKDPERMLAERKELSEYLGGRMGREVRVIVPLTSSVILEGFSNGSIDLGYLSAMDMVNARRSGVAELLLVGEIKGRRDYKSYWVGRKEAPYRSVEDLRGKPVAFASRTSTSGYLVPMWDLVKRGLVKQRGDAEEFFGRGNVWYGTGYVSAVQQVLRGDAEAAAVSDYVLDGEKHLSAEDRAKLRKIAEQGPVPTHVIAVRASMSEAEKRKWREVLLKMNEENSQLRDSVFTSKLVEADAREHLAPLEEAMEAVGWQK